MKFSIKDFFSKCHQIYRKLPIWSHLLKKSLRVNFIFCAVISSGYVLIHPEISWRLVFNHSHENRFWFFKPQMSDFFSLKVWIRMKLSQLDKNPYSRLRITNKNENENHTNNFLILNKMHVKVGYQMTYSISSHQCSIIKGVLKISLNSQENNCTRPQAFIFIRTETLAQVFSFEFCEISKNTFFYRTPPNDCFYVSL